MDAAGLGSVRDRETVQRTQVDSGEVGVSKAPSA